MISKNFLISQNQNTIKNMLGFHTAMIQPLEIVSIPGLKPFRQKYFLRPGIEIPRQKCY